MAEPKKRIVVDGVDFGSLFRFPLILRCVTSAMQPPRLVIALLMVVALVAFGRTWDRWTEPRVHPEGLVAGDWSAEERDAVRDLLWNALREYVPESEHPPPGFPDARSAISKMEQHYRYRRSEREEGQSRDGELTGGVGPKVLKIDDERFLALKSQIEQLAPKGAFEATVGSVSGSVLAVVKGVIYLEPKLILDSFGSLFVGLPVALWQQERAFSIVFGIFFLLVVSVGGGALCRMAACQAAGQERLRVRDAFDFALGNWLKLLMTPVLPLLIAGGVAVVVILLGLFMAPYLDFVGGILYGFALLLGFLLAFLLIGYVFCFPLLLPAVACENCDAADAQQRAYAYVLSRPLHLVGYIIVALVGLAIGFVVVSLVAATMLNFTAALFGAFTANSAVSGTGGFGIFELLPQSPGEIHDQFHNRWAAWFVGFWQWFVISLVAAYVVAYLFSASTAVYLLMRRACDGQDIEEIWRPGLAPGTLVPLPRPIVRDSTDTGEDRRKGVTERAISGSMRTVAGVRFGGKEKRGSKAKSQPPEEQSADEAPDGSAAAHDKKGDAS